MASPWPWARVRRCWGTRQNHLGRRGQEIPAGSLILSGGVTEAVAVAAGDNVNLRVQGMGSVSLRFA